MDKDLQNKREEPGPALSRITGMQDFGKPCLYFNTLGRITGCNKAFADRFEINRHEEPGMDYNPPVQNKLFVEAVLKAGSEGISTFRGRIRLGQSSSEVYLEAVLFLNQASDHDGASIICYIQDSEAYVTATANTGKRLIHGLPLNVSALVSVHASDGSPVYISPSIELMLGYTNAEIKGVNPLSLVYPDDAPIVADVIDKLNHGYDFLNSRYRMVHKNGGIVTVETSSYVIPDATGSGSQIINVTQDLGWQVEIEHALENSEQKYYQLISNLPVGVALIGRNGQLLEANDSMKKIMELPLDTPLPEINFFSNGIMKRTGISAQLSKCIKTKEIVVGDIPYKSARKATELFLSYSFLPVPDHNREVEAVIGYVSDLTELKKAESDRSERADFLNLVINVVKSPFFVKDENHKWLMLNDAAVEMMGKPREALLGQSDYDLYPREQAEVFWQNDEKVLKSGGMSNEEQISWSDGTIHTIVTHKQLYTEKPSGRKYIVGTIHDISMYKKIEAELRASELKYRELFDNANDFIITLDMEGNITNANRTLLQHLCTDLESLTHRNAYEFVKEENREFMLGLRDQLLAGELVDAFEVEAFNLEGQQLIYEVKASVISHEGEIAGAQCVFSDVTQRREALLKLEEYNKNLVELNKTRDKFFSIIAHDLRNPFSSMIGFAELLLEDLDDLTKDEIRDSLKIIRNSGKNSLNLLENLLSWSRLETGRMPFNPVEIILSNVIDEVVNVLFSLAYRKKIEIHNLVEPDVVLFADKNMLNTILNNLVMNAIKFTPVGGEIKVFSGETINNPGMEKEFVKISVADTGVGMDEEMCKRIFSLNKPVSSPGTEKEQGTGLGLLLSREMVEKHGGSILVESTSGKGSVFSILIPAYKP